MSLGKVPYGWWSHHHHQWKGWRWGNKSTQHWGTNTTQGKLHISIQLASKTCTVSLQSPIWDAKHDHPEQPVASNGLNQTLPKLHFATLKSNYSLYTFVCHEILLRWRDHECVQWIKILCRAQFLTPTNVFTWPYNIQYICNCIT